MSHPQIDLAGATCIVIQVIDIHSLPGAQAAPPEYFSPPGHHLPQSRSFIYSQFPPADRTLAFEDHQTLIKGLVESHGQQLRRYLLARVRNAADVPDIVQEVFLRMMRVPNVESVRSPEAYLFTVAQHVVQQHTLKQSAMPPSADKSSLLT